MTSISSQSSVGSGKSRRFFKLKFSLPVSSASLKHLSSGIFPDMVGFTCYQGNIGTFIRLLFRRLGDILEISQPRAITAHGPDIFPISLWGIRGTRDQLAKELKVQPAIMGEKCLIPGYSPGRTTYDVNGSTILYSNKRTSVHSNVSLKSKTLVPKARDSFFFVWSVCYKIASPWSSRTFYLPSWLVFVRRLIIEIDWRIPTNRAPFFKQFCAINIFCVLFVLKR